MIILLIISGIWLVLFYMPTIRLTFGETRFEHHGADVNAKVSKLPRVQSKPET